MSVPAASASSTLSARELVGQRRDEAVVDAGGHDEPRRRRAALAGREERALHRARSTAVGEVGVVEHDERVLAAHLELHLRHPRDRLGRDRAPGRHRAGEAERRDVGVVDQRLADDRAAAHHQVEHAGGQPGARQDVGERPGAAGHEVGRLATPRCCRRRAPGAIFHAGIAIGKFHGVIRPTTPSGSRVTSTSTPGRTDGELLAGQAQHLAGEELEDVAGARRLADALGQRLAFLARQQRARARPCARGSRSPAVSRMFARSWIEPVAQAGNAAFAAAIAASRLRGVGLRVLADHVARCRTDCG